MSIEAATQTTVGDLQVVCVSHRREIFDEYLGASIGIDDSAVRFYDNTGANVAIPYRYNHFIDNEMGAGWVMFAHHDMRFEEDPWPLIRNLPTSSIYGVVGAVVVPGRRYLHIGREAGRLRITRGRFRHVRCLGQVKCQTDLYPPGVFGEPVEDFPVVDTVDCCCIIVHSSLIRRHGLRFDPQFAWHFYSEDFSLTAKARFGIETRVVQIDCGHYGFGTLDSAFHTAQRKLVGKHAGVFASTCYLPPAATEINSFANRRGLLLQL
ncbi:hypothetical protein FOS14_23735 [Skermania sp. ID1734]|uniref:hypothetical protein n=1 Tax=Skermania sp. ID1734 TaxID=2597516 RepID=UPI00117DC482|nr:hypothetical protein [Skermania sp. ID1734]TSD93133.1 hypothetical protein FOS14_23735 [Skermania sp. ID1734]